MKESILRPPERSKAGKRRVSSTRLSDSAAIVAFLVYDLLDYVEKNRFCGQPGLRTSGPYLELAKGWLILRCL